MAYEALYTRARPKNLAQLIGQTHISTTLTRAINQDRMSHAYLLVGTRGTGKTSTARILAKAINCETVHNAKETNSELPANKIPCNECDACKNFKSSPDNIEFDAASNRSVEDVSRLLSTAYLAPIQSRFKTFIIDEIHMLTNEAINSILKMIEEPPKNVIFFLATTEFNKVPMTIRSRCQILNFKLIPTELIADYLTRIATRLNLSVEEEAMYKVARLARGSMRDAMTFLDQCYSMSDNNSLTLDMVDSTLGLVSDADLDDIIDSAISKNRIKIIQSTAKIFKSGLTADNIAESLITNLRDKVSKIVDPNSSKLAVYNEIIDKLRQAVIEMQGSGIPEVILETTLFKFASTPLNINTSFTNNTNFVSQIPQQPPAPIKPVINTIIEHKEEKKVEWQIHFTEENQIETAKTLLNKLYEYFSVTDFESEIKILIKNLIFAEFVDDTIFFSINSVAFERIFQEHHKRIEKLIQEKTGEYLKIELVNDEDYDKEQTAVALIVEKINNLPAEEKKYTKDFIKLLNVDYENIQIISSVEN